jgi:hypothetical protein
MLADLNLALLLAHKLSTSLVDLGLGKLQNFNALAWGLLALDPTQAGILAAEMKRRLCALSLVNI